MRIAPKGIFQLLLRIFSVISILGYLLFLIGERVPLFSQAGFQDISVYLLFLIFLLGFYFLWKNELTAGILLLIWHGIQWILVMWVWVDGAMTLVLGFPVALLGLAALIFGLIQKTKAQASKTDS